MKRKEELEALRDIEQKAKSAEKIIRSLAFRNQDIDFDVKINKSYRQGVLPYYLDFFFDIDVDKHFEKSPTYDKQYADATWEWEDRIEAALRYVNLQNYFGGILFDYINDDLVSMEIDRLNNKLEKYIKSQYPEVTDEKYREADIFYYLYKSEADQPHMRVEFIGLPIESDEVSATRDGNLLFTCDDLYDMMLDIYLRSPLHPSFEYENFTCQ